jgi:hypothetical protein
MSFHWNLSSEDELEEEEDEVKDNRLAPSPNIGSPRLGDSKVRESGCTPVAAAIAAPVTEMYSDDEGIDWEDADDVDDLDSGESDTKQGSAGELRPVTITMEQPGRKKGDKTGKISRKRNRKVYRNAALSSDFGELLKNIHKAHLLTLVSRAVLLSKASSNHNILHLALSLIPLGFEANALAPSFQQLKSFCLWFYEFVNRVSLRRQAKLQANTAAGAPRNGSLKRLPWFSQGVNSSCSASPKTLGHGDSTPLTLTRLCSYLSTTHDEDPQLVNDMSVMTNTDKVQLMLAMIRSLGWRARFVVVLDPVRQDLDVDHPLLAMEVNVFQTFLSKSKRFKSCDGKPEKTVRDDAPANDGASSLAWVEVLCQVSDRLKWIPLDIQQEWIDEPRSVEARWYATKKAATLNLKRRLPVVYVLGVEHLAQDEDTLACRLTDVTPRYANSWSKSQKARGEDCHRWFGETVHILNSVDGASSKQSARRDKSGRNSSEAIDVDHDVGVGVNESMIDDEIVAEEKLDLVVAGIEEIMPTNKIGFASHSVFALSSQLGVHEVLAPDAKARICGMFKGELVYRRSDVTTAKVAKKWLYEGRKVKDGEKPIKRVKARKKVAPTGFKPLSTYGVGVNNDGSEGFRVTQISVGSAPENDGMDDLFAFWQTEAWSPVSVGPDDMIPVNEYRNIELALLNPGLVHVDRPRIALVAKKLEM